MKDEVDLVQLLELAWCAVYVVAGAEGQPMILRQFGMNATPKVLSSTSESDVSIGLIRLTQVLSQ